MFGTADWIQVITIVVFTLTAAIIDVRSRRIPNWITIPAAVAGLLFHVLRGAYNDGFAGSLHGLWFSLGGFATGFGILLVLMAFALGGGGDVKLMGAVGAWLGWRYTIIAYVLAVIFAVGGIIVLSFFTVARHGVEEAKKRHLDGGAEEKQRRTPGRRKRSLTTFALPVALGTWIALVWQFVAHKQ